MAGFTDTIRILVTADGSAASRELKNVGDGAQREMDKANKATRNWSASLTRAGVGMVTFAGIAGAGLFKAAQAADEAAQAQLRLDNSIKNNPKLAASSAAAFRDLATALSKKTAADDDSIISGQAVLAQFKLSQDEILGLTPLLVDLSRKMGIDMNAAAKAVGKAMDGSTVALKKYGVSIKAGADGTIDFNDVMDGLRGVVGGFAEEEGKTFSGQMEILKNQLGEVAEGIGAGVLPMFQSMLGPVQSVAEAFGNMNPETQALVGQLGGLAVAGVGIVGTFTLIAGQAIKVRDALTVLHDDGTRSLSGLGKAAKFTAITAGLITLGSVLKDIVWADTPSDSALVGGFDKFAASLLNNVTSADAARDAIDGLGKQVSDFLANIDPTGNENTGFVVFDQFPAAAAGMSDALLGSQADLDKFIQKVRDTVPVVEGVSNPVDNVAASLTNLRAQLQGNASEAMRNMLATGELTTAQYDAAIAYGTAANGSIDYVQALKSVPRVQTEAARATDRHAVSLSKLTTWVLRYQDRLLSANDKSRAWATAQLDLADAQDQVAEAQKAVADAVAQYGADSPEAAQATRDYQRALIGASQSQDDATRAALDHAAALAGYEIGGKNGEKASQKFRDSLKEIASTMDPGSPLRQNLERYIAGLDKTKGERKAKVKAEGADEAKGKVDGVNASLDRVDGRHATATITVLADFAGRIGDTLAGILGFAQGGHVRAGVPIIVGEQGPEVFVPPTGGEIVPNHRLGDMGGRSLYPVPSSGKVSAPVYVFNFNGPVASERDAERWVTNAMARSRRRGDALVA